MSSDGRGLGDVFILLPPRSGDIMKGLGGKGAVRRPCQRLPSACRALTLPKCPNFEKAPMESSSPSASAHSPAHKKRLSKGRRLMRLLTSTCDPRAWAHVLKLVNYYNYSHVTPLRSLRIGPGAGISPNASFSNPERIEAGRGLHLGAHCTLWAGPRHGRIVMGDNVLFAPNVLITAANYRFNDGHPVTEQAMEEADVIIGNDVWLGAGVIVLPGARIGDGAVIAAGAVVRGEIPAMAIAAGMPARVVSWRHTDDPAFPTPSATA